MSKIKIIGYMFISALLLMHLSVISAQADFTDDLYDMYELHGNLNSLESLDEFLHGDWWALHDLTLDIIDSAGKTSLGILFTATDAFKDYIAGGNPTYKLSNGAVIDLKEGGYLEDLVNSAVVGIDMIWSYVDTKLAWGSSVPEDPVRAFWDFIRVSSWIQYQR